MHQFFTNFSVQNPSQHQHFFWDFYLVDVNLVNAAISNKTKWPYTTTLGRPFLKVFTFSQCTGQVLLENALSRVNFNIFGNLNHPN